MSRGTLTCDLSNDLDTLSLPLLNWMIDTCENIIFPPLRWRMVKKSGIFRLLRFWWHTLLLPMKTSPLFWLSRLSSASAIDVYFHRGWRHAPEDIALEIKLLVTTSKSSCFYVSDLHSTSRKILLWYGQRWRED